MVRRSWKGLAMCLAALTPIVAPAQGLFDVNLRGDPLPKIELGGSPAIDLVVLRGGMPSAPLRNGNVKPGSERVEFNGRVLNRGSEYTIDYDSGVVYLMRQFRPGDSVIVSYRYDATKPANSEGQRFNGFSGFRFDLVSNGALKGIFGFGLTERQADGSVLTSNIYGLNNKFSLAGSSLSGLFLVGDRQKAQSEDVFGPAQQEAPVDIGKSKFLLQDLAGRFGGGKFSASYQDISQNFSGFGAVRESGVDGALVDQLQKEKGLRRLGFSLENVALGGLKVSNSFKSVEDGGSSIDWRSFALGQGDPDKGKGFSVSWNSRTIDSDFKRFKDIREEDREQLLREAGLTRERFSGLFRTGIGRLSFSQDKVQDGEGNGIYKRKFEFFDGTNPESSKVFASIGDQHVERGFNRIGSLTDPEKQEYAREGGLRRQWAKLQFGLWDQKNPLKFSQNVVRTDSGDLSSTKFEVGGKNWGIQHLATSVDKGFSALDNLPDPEKNEQIQQIAQMYAAGGEPVKPDAERGWLMRSQGIDRQVTRLSWKPAKNWNLNLESLDINGQTDGTSVQTASLAGKDLSLSYRRQEMGDRFGDLNNLLDFERQRLGNIIGLDRTDIAADFKIAGSSVSLTRLEADSRNGGAKRDTLKLTGKNVDISISQRSVDGGFNEVGQLLDPEKDLLATLKGFTERDIKAKFQMIPGLWIDVFWFDALNQALEETRKVHNASLTYAPNKDTNLTFLRLDNQNDNPFNLLFANVLERMTMMHNFGKLGVFQYLKETQKYDGANSNQPDFVKQHLSYETKINPKTMVKTEQTRTEFDDGSAENVSQNTVSSQITKGAGVSVSEINVDREGQDNDQTKRNYGFWVDLGKGLRFSYGYARNLEGEASTMNSGITLGSGGDPLKGGENFGNNGDGQMGDWSIGGGYGVNRWDESGRTQSFSKVQLGTVKPQRVLGLHDVRFNFGLDTQADYGNWLRENRLVQFSGMLGNNSFAYEYRGQMHQSGIRAIDRTFKFQTDQDPKRWLVASLLYKVRTLPWDDQVMIRDFNITARPAKNFEIVHKLQTNPEGPRRDDVILGSIPQPIRNNQWRLDYKSGKSWSLGGQYDEVILEQNNSRARKAGMNLGLFQTSGSPLSIYYGLEQNDLSGQRKTMQRYSLRFDQRPGPNQMLSMFLSNESFQNFVSEGMKRSNWTMRLDYQLRF